MSVSTSQIYLGDLNQSETLIVIERFVRAIMKRQGPYPRSLPRYKRESFCDVILKQLPRLLSFYKPNHDFSEHIEAFWSGCEMVGLLECGELTPFAKRLYSQRVDSIALVEELSELILQYTDSDRFRNRSYERRRHQKEKYEALKSHARLALDRYARVLVVRLDLAYLEGANIEIVDVYMHLEAVTDQIRARIGIFENLIGYAWAIEQGGRSKGYHIHFAFLLPGHLHHSDGRIGQILGEMWIDMTGGFGIYHCPSADQDEYERLGRRGVGMIHRESEREKENAMEVIAYLADPEKEDQFLRMKPCGRRTFAMGLMGRRAEATQVVSESHDI